MATSNDASTTTKPNPKFGYGPPTQAGKIPFIPPGTDRQCETAYQLWGDLKGKVPPLIILHGGPGAPGRDMVTLTVLNDRYNIPVLIYDQIGCGDSTHLRELRGDTTFWTDDLFLAELANVRKYFGIETFDLYGHSCGGILALLYTLTKPHGLRKLILASCGASDKDRLRDYAVHRAELPPEMHDILVKCEEEGRTEAAEYENVQNELAKRTLCRMDPWPAEIMATMKLLGEDDTVDHTLYGGLGVETRGSRKNYNCTARLPEITEAVVPGGVLLTNGRYDMTRDESVSVLFRGIRARVKWVQFARSAHMPHVEESEAYVMAMKDFLMID